MCKATLPTSVSIPPSDEDGDANKLKWIKTPRTRLPNAKSRIKSDTMNEVLQILPIFQGLKIEYSKQAHLVGDSSITSCLK